MIFIHSNSPNYNQVGRNLMATIISVPELKTLLESTGLYAVIDVRDWGEFSLGQIPGASCIPRGSLEKYMAVLVPQKGVKTVLYCDTGQRSARAATTLETLGYTDVSILDGGLKSWQAAGGETIHGWSLRGKEYGERLQVEEQIPDLTAAELHTRLQQGEKFYIFDTRTEPEFQALHLPGAYCTPGGQLALMATDTVQDQNRPIIINCAGRTRSLLGAHLLRRMGFSNVYALKGGTGAWRIAGHGNELESGSGATLPPVSAAGQVACAQFAERVASEDGIPFLSPEELRARQEQGKLLYLLDVRQLDEYQAGHIPGALFCPGTQAALLVECLVGVKNATVVTMCDGRARAILVASLLKGAGYPQVSVLDGGTKAWVDQGFGLAAGAPQEIDYGQPVWMARLLQGLPSGIEPQELPIPGLAEASAQATFITPEVLQSKLVSSERPALLDVRSAGDFATAHIPGSRWLSQGNLDLQIEQVVPNKATPLVLMCRRGKLSPLSVPTLKDMGYQQVAILQGGFAAWKAAQFPVEQGLGEQVEFEELAIAEVGLFGGGPYGFSHERMAQYLRDEEALGHKYRPKGAQPHS
jgi:rhodanese-related sulfurtransferase